MKVVVVGSTGQAGVPLVRLLREREVRVGEASRSAGVDVTAGTGLVEAFTGADVVVDCTNVVTTRSKVSTRFFTAAAGNIADAAIATGVSRVVCLSIINAVDSSVNSGFGYYQGKAAQERVYTDRCKDPDGPKLIVVASAQWFELADQMLSQTRIGPVAFVPHMLTAPLSCVDAVGVLADVVAGDLTPPVVDGVGRVEVSGSRETDLVDIATALARHRGSPRWVRGINFGGKAVRSGGLLPLPASDRVASVRVDADLDRWLDSMPSA